MSDDTEIDRSVGRHAWERRQLCRELAAGEMTGAALARKYGVTRQAISAFRKRHAREIDEIKADLNDQFRGLWIASKEARIAAYEADYEMSAGGEYAGHYDQVKARTAILHAVSEELGQLPNRSATVAIVPVAHIIEGVDLDALK